MNIQRAIEILELHNKWRRDNDGKYEMAEPEELGKAIDLVVSEFKNLHLQNVSRCKSERIMTDIFNVKDKLPDVECGSYLVYAPQSFPKNSRWLVAEYYDDVKGFYSESSENFLEDVTHWCELPKEPESK